MAQHASAEKRHRQNERRRIRNKANISKMKTLMKRVQTATDKENAQKAYRSAVKFLDQLAAKGIIHKNKAANQKSRLTRLLNTMK